MKLKEMERIFNSLGELIRMINKTGTSALEKDVITSRIESLMEEIEHHMKNCDELYLPKI